MRERADLERPEVPDLGERARTALAAFGLSVGGFVAGVFGLFVVRLLVGLLGVGDTEAYRLLAGHHIQFGFAVFAIGYLLVRDDRERFARLRRPTLVDVGWIVAGQPLVIYLGLLVGAVTATFLGHPTFGGASESIELADNLHLWPVALVGLYGFAAPAEELVYRGIVQGRLRESFATPGVVLLGGLLFGFMHLLVGLLTPEVGLDGALTWGIGATVPGFVWGLAYEQTDNLLVTSLLHAMAWTVPFEAVLPFV